MARLNNLTKEDMKFWINEESKIEYHKKCARCKNQCKQSYRCVEVICPKYLRR